MLWNRVLAGVLLWSTVMGAAQAQMRTPRGGPVAGEPWAAPNHAAATGIAPTAMNVTWDPVPGAKAYQVERRRVDNPTCCLLQSGPLNATSWQDNALEPGVEYTYTVSAYYADGRVGTTEVGAVTPMPPLPTVNLSRTARMAAGSDLFATTPCSVKSAGPGPNGISPYAQSPAGLAITWTGPTNAKYIVDRAPTGTNNWVLVGSSCGGPSPVVYSGGPGISLKDMAGGVQAQVDYTYRVTSVGSNGESGWNTVHWTAPGQGTVTVTPTVQGSTVTLSGTYWPALNSAPSVPMIPPSRFEISSSYGYTAQQNPYLKNDFTLKVYGVPVGTHTFTVFASWYNGGASKVTSVPVTVAY